jgi:hypothetical protein
MRVEVFFNLHNGLWSVRALNGAYKGRVVGHAHTVLIRDARFMVQPGGRERVIREGRKNVHAFVRGDLEAAKWSNKTNAMLPKGSAAYMPWTRDDTRYRRFACEAGQVVTYNPYRFSTFVDADALSPVFNAPMVCMTPDCKVRMFDPYDMVETAS